MSVLDLHKRTNFPNQFHLQLPLKDTILHLAARRRDAKLVGVFIELGSPVDKTNAEGQTPLHIAAINGDQKLLQILLMARSDANICDSMVNYIVL